MKKKLLFIITTLKIGGGAERITSLLTTALSEKYKIYILTFFDSKDLYQFKGKYNSLKESLILHRRIFNSIIRPIRIYKVIRTISPNIIISSMDFSTIFTIISKFLFRIKIPLINITHTNPKKAYKKFSYLNFFIRAFYPLEIVDKIITISKSVQEILEKDYGIRKNKLKTIYDGIELNMINLMANEKIFEDKGVFYNTNLIKFITVGRLHKVKGYKYLIEAFYIVKKEIPNSKLIIIGDGPLKKEIIISIKDKNLEKDVLMLGIKKNPFKYIANSDVFVLASQAEGFGIALIEALALKIPIISTDCVGPKEILEDGKYGILVKKKDSRD